MKAGDHCLVPDHVYGPARNFCNGVLKRYGVEITYYTPEIDEADRVRMSAIDVMRMCFTSGT